MFQGTIPDAARRMIRQFAEQWQTDHAAVACCGNLTIERTLAPLNRFQLHSCDVSIYSCALGTYYARQPFRLDLKPEHEALWGWLRPTLATPTDRLATVMLLTNVLQGISATGQIAANAYYRRLMQAYRDQWGTLLAKTRARLEQNPLKLTSFHAGDAVDWLPTLPENAAVASFPPFFAKGYEVMWHKLDVLFDWDKPAYQEIFEERRRLFLHHLTNREYWVFGTSYPLDEYTPFLRGRCQTSNRGVPLYLYAKLGTARVITPRQRIAPITQPRLTPGEKVAPPLAILPLPAHQFDALRAQHLNPTIKPASASLALGVYANNLLVGAFAFRASYQAPGAQPDTMYLLTDFAIAPTDYPRLSKLVLYAALSHEAQRYAERIVGRRIRHLFTTAFTNNPVSMKYRGLFELHSRKETPADPDHRYALNYTAPAGQWSLAEGFTIWQKKHGGRTHD